MLLHSRREDQIHYSAIKLLFAGVTHSRGRGDGGVNALKLHSNMHVHIQLVQAGGVQALDFAAPD